MTLVPPEKVNQALSTPLPAVPSNYTSTADVRVSDKIIDQVIGQEKAVELIRKAAAQKRNVLLVGLPGTGKSMLAQAMAEILPLEKLEDVLVYPNNADPNNPKVRTVPAGEGKKILHRLRLDSQKEEQNTRMMGMILPMGWFILSYIIWSLKWISDVIYAATLLLGGFVIIGVAVGSQIRPRSRIQTPKLLIDNAGKKTAPFVEATGARAGALLSDVRHDPLQSFSNVNKLLIRSADKFVEVAFEDLWTHLTEKYPSLIETFDNNYQVIRLPLDESIYTYAVKDGQIVLSRILSMNRRPYTGKIVDLKVNNKTLSLTPEHKVVTPFTDKEISEVSPQDELLLLDELKELAVAVPLMQ